MDAAIVHRFQELILQDVDESADARENSINTRAPRSASAPPGPSSSFLGLFTVGISKEVCIVCREKHHLHDVLRAPCGHFHCRECFHRRAEMSTRDESLFPPSCCGQEIPLLSGSHFLEKELWEVLKTKAREYETANRTYCYDASCSAFISSEHVRLGVATCPKCSKETCAMCKGRPHIDFECPEDPVEKELEALAKAEKWARCPNCKRRVERDGGCNHMTYGIIPSPFFRRR